MNIITALPLAILRAQYTIVRYPLRLVDEQVIAHLAPAAPARRLYRGSLSLLDCAVGTVLGHQDRAHDAADTTPRVTLVSGTASDTDRDPSAPDNAAADAETAPRSATVENAELNEKAAHQLDTDLLAEHLEDIETQYQLEHPPDHRHRRADDRHRHHPARGRREHRTRHDTVRRTGRPRSRTRSRRDPRRRAPEQHRPANVTNERDCHQ